MAYRKFRISAESEIIAHMYHYPLFSWRAREHNRYHFYGHSHGTSEKTLNMLFPNRLAMDVGLDMAHTILGQWRPFSLEEVVAFIEERNKQQS
jgi:hypothetical protein